VLAAGASTRYGGVKQRELLPDVLAALRASSVDGIVVVEGAHRIEPGPLREPGSRVSFVHCADWERGPGASLRCGLAALGDDVTRAVIVLADGPELDPRAVDRLLVHPAPVAAASYAGVRSHPVALARSAWGHIPDEGGRGLEPVLVDCSDLRPPGDVDVRR
jgi:CTP:molybdopterin cytidylyltransferase MocA